MYLAKAYVMRLEVVMMLIVAKSRHINGKLALLPSVREQGYKTYIRRQMEPALLLVALENICRRGPAEELMTSSIFPETNKSTMRNIKPVKTPMATHAIMILGPSTAAFGISSMQ